MTGRDAATRLADLEDRLVDQAGPTFNSYAQMLEGRRRLVWALQWLKLAKAAVEDDTDLRFALSHVRQAIKFTEKRRDDG